MLNNYSSKMFTKHIILVAIFATVVSCREFYISNNLEKDIVVSITGHEDVTIGRGKTVIANVEENFEGRVTAVYADCKDAKCKTFQTLAEFTLGKTDWYDVSLVEGFNLPIRVTPRSSNFCRQASCYSEDLLKKCPSKKQVLVDGKVVSCKHDEKLFDICSLQAVISATDYSNALSCVSQPIYNINFEFVE